MTGNGVLTGKDKAKIAADPKPSAIKNLQDVVVRLQRIKSMNESLQGQYAPGSATWNVCESIDDNLHEIFGLLGE